MVRSRIIKPLVRAAFILEQLSVVGEENGKEPAIRTVSIMEETGAQGKEMTCMLERTVEGNKFEVFEEQGGQQAVEQKQGKQEEKESEQEEQDVAIKRMEIDDSPIPTEVERKKSEEGSEADKNQKAAKQKSKERVEREAREAKEMTAFLEGRRGGGSQS